VKHGTAGPDYAEAVWHAIGIMEQGSHPVEAMALLHMRDRQREGRYMDITEDQLNWMGSLFPFCLVNVFPTITTAVALLREQQVLGRLYWHWIMARDRRRERH
jgi:hypothetical protein